jgi:maltose alpha-D-glucosyltransferase/alpha-amylase
MEQPLEAPAPAPALDALWYKDAVIYELHVRAFADANGDGIGDFKGLTGKLDYLQDLGVTAVWLLPFYPSPLRDDGYDIANYTDVHPSYGTLDDFKEFLDAAHAHGLRVITELVINHTSDQHPWFQRARRARPGSVERDFYVWSDTPDRYKDARIIFQDFEPSNWSWDPVAKSYFMHRFYAHQPDLNYDNPAVHDAIIPVLDFWMALGVDGMRLDAVPYLYKREGTTCENLPETHGLLKKLRRHVDEKFPGRMILAEANMWPEDASAYFGDGDECNMAFHFPLMPRMFMGLRMEDRFPMVDILDQTPAIPPNCQWALFLRNHDELTLEMVTDEERDYMVRAYARDPRMRINLGIRRRLAPLMGNSRRRIELMHGLLFSLPGTPVMYYGDEIGMGDNIYLGDRNGVRTPMQWSPDRNAGFSRANPQQLFFPVIIDPEYHYEANNVEAQQNNPNSLLWWIKRVLDQRKRVQAFGRGEFAWVNPDNPKCLAYLRTYDPERVLVVANLSRFPQYVTLNLGDFAGMIPVEMFGQTEFPPLGRDPYQLALGPHSFYWFRLEARPHVEGALGEPPGAELVLPAITVARSWEDVFRGPGAEALEEVLPGHLRRRRWFRPNNRVIRAVRLDEAAQVPGTEPVCWLAGVRVEYLNGDAESYLLPLAFAPEESAGRLLESSPQVGVARLRGAARGVLYDAQGEPSLGAELLRLLSESKRITGRSGVLFGTALPEAAPALADGAEAGPVVTRWQQGWLSFDFGGKLELTPIRRLVEGAHPELEIGRFLARSPVPAPVIPLVGALEYRSAVGAEPTTVAVLHAQVAHQADAWQHALAALSLYFERVLAADAEPPDLSPDTHTLFELAEANQPGPAARFIETYLDTARTIGRRTAELHRALASDPEDPRFAPEPFTAHHLRGVSQSMRNRARQVLPHLARQLSGLSEDLRPLAQVVLDHQPELLQRYRRLIDRKVGGLRIRTHGHYFLGHLLYTGRDFVISHFEGDKLRTPADRRSRRSALSDVVDMVCSFRQAAHTAWRGEMDPVGGRPGPVREEDRARLEPWMRFWYGTVAAAFLHEYFTAAGDAPFLPPTRGEREMLSELLFLDQAVGEVGEALRERPDWLPVRLRTLLLLLTAPQA